MRIIRASELGGYLYCRRAWWYRQQGVESQNENELAAGSQFHREHGRKLLEARLLRVLGWLALLAALLAAAIGLTLQVLP
jgi:CRISPR/Cas system-associated exonuclease Cas4 (RecB family)